MRNRLCLLAALAALPASSWASTLKVTTDPPGAAVQIDGVGYGPSPVTVPKVAAGSHVVRVSMEGYVTREDSVKVGVDEDIAIQAPLAPMPKVVPQAPRPAPAPAYPQQAYPSQPAYQPQPVYQPQPGYAPQPQAYPAQPAYPPQPQAPYAGGRRLADDEDGPAPQPRPYAAQPAPQPAYPPQPVYQPQPGYAPVPQPQAYAPQPGYPQPAPQGYAPQAPAARPPHYVAPQGAATAPVTPLPVSQNPTAWGAQKKTMSLKVETNPVGASVQVVGMPDVKVAPAYFTGFAPGTITLLVRAPGYQDKKVQVDIQMDSRTLVTLDPLR